MTTPTYLDLHGLCLLTNRALAADDAEVSAERLLELLMARAEQKGVSSKFVPLPTGVTACDFCLVYPIYADWVTDIGVELGHECRDTPLAEWCANMPNITQVFVSLRRLVMARLETLEQEKAKKVGYGLADVIERSGITGEEFEQSKARLHAQKVGLKPAK